MNENFLLSLHRAKLQTCFSRCFQQMSVCGVVRAAPLMRIHDLYSDFNISFPLSCLEFRYFLGKTPWLVILAWREEKLYI